MPKSDFFALLGYAPDAAPTVLGVLTGCNGVVPTLRGLKGAPSPVATPLPTLAAACQGAAVLTKLDGTTRMFAGTSTKLYEAGTSTWTDVSQAATYTGSTSARWRFAQQENVSFAANGADTIQASVSTGAFSCIPGAPIAKIVETVGKFVFGIGTSTNAHGVQWCALGDYTGWTASQATQAGSDTLEESPGPATAGKRFGNALIVFKKNSMFVGSYTAPPNIWQFQLIPGTAGAMSQEAVVNIGTAENPKLVFMGEDDFYLYDGSPPRPIGTNRVKNEVFGSLVQSRFASCAALHDPKNNLVYFFFPTADQVNPNSCRVYNYRTDRWGVDNRTIEAATEYVASAISYSGLGAVYANYQDLPNVAYSVALVGSTQTFPAIFNASHEIKTLTGPATDTTLTTGDLGDDNLFTLLNGVTPRFITSPDAATMTNFYKLRAGDALSADAAVSLSAWGKFDVLREARWHRLQFNFSGDWEMDGVVPEWEPSGTA